jgi:hypothetical protein
MRGYTVKQRRKARTSSQSEEKFAREKAKEGDRTRKGIIRISTSSERVLRCSWQWSIGRRGMMKQDRIQEAYYSRLR